MGKKHKHKTNKLVLRLNNVPLRRISLVPEQRHIKECTTKANNKAYIYNSELSFLGKCILDYPSIETGGQLFGYWTASGTPVVVYAIGPGPRANHQVAFFNQDVQYLERVGHILVSQFGLMHIGEWHSHHTLGLDRPSSHDAHTMQKSIDERHLNRFLLCIGNCRGSQFSIQPYNFIENSTEYSLAKWEIKGEMSPYRFQIDSYLTNLELATRQSVSVPEEKSWFVEKNNRLQLKHMIDYMKMLPGSVESKAQLVENTVELITTFVDRTEVVTFPQNFPDSFISITIKYHNREETVLKNKTDNNNISNIGANLHEIFKQQYNSLTHDFK